MITMKSETIDLDKADAWSVTYEPTISAITVELAYSTVRGNCDSESQH